MEQIKYKSEVFDEMIRFNQEKFSLRQGVLESFEDRFFKNPYSENAIQNCQFIIENQKIFGQFLVLPTQFHYQNIHYKGVWGVDFILDDTLRGKNFGRNLAEEIFKISNYCVVGVSDVSLRIHLKNGNHIVGYAKRFIKFNSMISPIRLFLPKKIEDRNHRFYPDIIKVGDLQIKRVLNTDNWVFPKAWNPDFLEWDRSKEFINWRFLLHKNKYAIYTSEDFYFVIRQVKWRKLNALILVDYRYKLGEKQHFKTILNALNKISKQSNSDVIIGFSSIPGEFDMLKKNLYFNFGRNMEIMTTCNEVANTKKVVVTMADSDIDTFYGDNIW